MGAHRHVVPRVAMPGSDAASGLGSVRGSVNTITTRRVDYAHHITASSPGRIWKLSGISALLAPPDFCRSVNSISTREADYAHQIMLAHPGFSDLPTALTDFYANLKFVSDHWSTDQILDKNQTKSNPMAWFWENDMHFNLQMGPSINYVSIVLGFYWPTHQLEVLNQHTVFPHIVSALE